MKAKEIKMSLNDYNVLEIAKEIVEYTKWEVKSEKIDYDFNLTGGKLVSKEKNVTFGFNVKKESIIRRLLDEIQKTSEIPGKKISEIERTISTSMNDDECFKELMKLVEKEEAAKGKKLEAFKKKIDNQKTVQEKYALFIDVLKEKITSENEKITKDITNVGNGIINALDNSKEFNEVVQKKVKECMGIDDEAFRFSEIKVLLLDLNASFDASDRAAGGYLIKVHKLRPKNETHNDEEGPGPVTQDLTKAYLESDKELDIIIAEKKASGDERYKNVIRAEKIFYDSEIVLELFISFDDISKEAAKKIEEKKEKQI
jgi:hypothetical protein